MKLWEVLRLLEDNPKKVFKCVKPHKVHVISTEEVEGNYYYSLTTTDFRGEDISFKRSGGFDGNFTVDGNWEEVKQPVAWQEAIEAWVNGKTIKSVHEGDEAIYLGGRNFLIGRGGVHVDKYEIKNGTWYIED